MSKRKFSPAVAALAVGLLMAVLCGCGQKGDLYLPDKTTSESRD